MRDVLKSLSLKLVHVNDAYFSWARIQSQGPSLARTHGYWVNVNYFCHNTRQQFMKPILGFFYYMKAKVIQLILFDIGLGGRQKALSLTLAWRRKWTSVNQDKIRTAGCEPTSRYCLNLDPCSSVLVVNTVLKSRFQQKTESNTDGSRGFNEGITYEVWTESKEPSMDEEALRNQQQQEVNTP